MNKIKGMIIPEHTAEEVQAVVNADDPKFLAEWFGYEIDKKD